LLVVYLAWQLVMPGPPSPTPLKKSAEPIAPTEHGDAFERARSNLVALTATVSTSSDGQQRTVAYKADGSRVTRLSGPSKPRPVAQRELRLANGAVIEVLDSDEKKSSTLANYEEWLLGRRDPSADCVKDFRGSTWSGETVVGEEQVRGLKIILISKGSLRSGYAPSANCELVKTEWSNGSQTRQSTLLSIAFGEPDARLFLVPDRYREVAPSDLRGYSKGSDRALKVDAGYLKAHKALLMRTASAEQGRRP